jgi:hypothetical protein
MKMQYHRQKNSKNNSLLFIALGSIFKINGKNLLTLGFHKIQSLVKYKEKAFYQIHYF